MPNAPITRVQRALLVQMADGGVLVGTLGKDPRYPNHRIFETSSGTLVERNTAVSLLRRGMLKIISVEEPRNYMVVTEAGRLGVIRYGSATKVLD